MTPANYSALNISGAALPLKTSGGGRLMVISVLVAGTVPGAAHDTDDTTKVGAQNKIAVIPNTVGVYQIGFPLKNGLVIVPGTGQTVAVSWG
jgi:hypothetical protein